MEKITFKIGFPRSQQYLKFALRMISVADESAFIQRFVDLADDGSRAEKHFGIYVDALADWSVEMPMLINAEGKETPVGKKGEDPASAVRSYFADRTTAQEWLADYAIRAYRSQLQPNVSFL
jgi:hypothetical protein